MMLDKSKKYKTKSNKTEYICEFVPRINRWYRVNPKNQSDIKCVTEIEIIRTCPEIQKEIQFNLNLKKITK